MTCYSYVCQFTKIEFDWIVTAHEHLNLLDDFLIGSSLKPEKENVEEGSALPMESLVFIDELKNNLLVRVLIFSDEFFMSSILGFFYLNFFLFFESFTET